MIRPGPEKHGVWPNLSLDNALLILELRALSFKGSTVRLSLGVVDAFTTTFLPPFLVDFKRRHPEIDLRCFPMTAEEISRQLEKGSLDCALFMSFDGPGEEDWMLGSVSLEYVARCRNYCWVSTRSHLASQREMSLHQFAQNPVALRESVDLGFFEIVNAEEKVELIDFLLVTEPHMIAQIGHEQSCGLPRCENRVERFNDATTI